MHKDWENLLKKWAEQEETPPLPLNHEALFEAKLRRGQRKRRFEYGIAASLLILLGLSTTWILNSGLPAQESIQKFQKAEFQLMQNIDTEFTLFESLDSPNTNEIITTGKTRLIRLQKDYQSLYSQWEKNPNQPQFIPALLQNLNLQRELLNTLNQDLTQLKNNTYESL
jgi:hypothetical protein